MKSIRHAGTPTRTGTRTTAVRGAAIALVAVGLAQIVTIAAAAAAPTASPGVRITRIQYDSRGPDDHTNASINREFVVLRNTGSQPVALSGYTLRDKTGHVFAFTTAFTLAPGATIPIFSGKGSNTAAYRHWGASTYIWNNGGDTATLRDAQNHSLQSCSWKSVLPGYEDC